MVPADLTALLADLPADFDRSAFAAVYAEAVALATSARTPGREPAYRLLHGHRVARLGLQLLDEPDVAAAGPAEGARPVVWLAGLLHDLFKEGLGADAPGTDHAAASRDWAARHLPPLFGADTAQRVAEACWLHNKRQLPAPVEARVLQDADLLDHFGAQEVWLAAYFSASRGQGLAACLAYLTGEVNGRWRRYALDHVHFDSARAALVERLRYADALIARLQAEAEGRLRP